jgi:hypothetical protein
VQRKRLKFSVLPAVMLTLTHPESEAEEKSSLLSTSEQNYHKE